MPWEEVKAALGLTGRYTVQVARRATKAIAAFPRREQQRVRAAIDLLADHPRPPGCVAMSSEAHAYHVRVGDYSIVYAVIDNRPLCLTDAAITDSVAMAFCGSHSAPRQ